jgi:2-amino-4-hydroxy-6-hydroxymethyldihydropteridine diphosphokinase
LQRLLALEARMGRVRTVAQGPRVIDLDLLLYGDRRVDEPGLTVPHPRILARAFVLAPLAEVLGQAVRQLDLELLAPPEAPEVPLVADDDEEPGGRA